MEINSKTHFKALRWPLHVILHEQVQQRVRQVLNLTCATGDCALAPGPIMPGELGWLDFMMAVPLDGILVVYPRVLLLEQQLRQANGGGPVSTGALLHLPSTCPRVISSYLCELSCTGDLL